MWEVGPHIGSPQFGLYWSDLLVLSTVDGAGASLQFDGIGDG